MSMKNLGETFTAEIARDLEKSVVTIHLRGDCHCEDPGLDPGDEAISALYALNEGDCFATLAMTPVGAERLPTILDQVAQKD